jgi:RND superfamily putative drug exporter
MFALFAAMVLGGNRTVDMFGVGLATAVLLDATVIRSVLLPATMTLLGRLNWWIPGWLDRVLPELRPPDRTPPVPLPVEPSPAAAVA